MVVGFAPVLRVHIRKAVTCIRATVGGCRRLLPLCATISVHSYSYPGKSEFLGPFCSLLQLRVYRRKQTHSPNVKEASYSLKMPGDRSVASRQQSEGRVRQAMTEPPVGTFINRIPHNLIEDGDRGSTRHALRKSKLEAYSRPVVSGPAAYPTAVAYAKATSVHGKATTLNASSKAFVGSEWRHLHDPDILQIAEENLLQDPNLKLEPSRQDISPPVHRCLALQASRGDGLANRLRSGRILSRSVPRLLTRLGAFHELARNVNGHIIPASTDWTCWSGPPTKNPVSCQSGAQTLARFLRTVVQVYHYNQNPIEGQRQSSSALLASDECRQTFDVYWGLFIKHAEQASSIPWGMYGSCHQTEAMIVFGTCA
ncbi:hypothetical protein BC835DRAFT_1306332 [Cytidiella melzeri]|nr:hypothetical protein BC835DRAFT_1306332 [Cytidiella melzeri]